MGFQLVFYLVVLQLFLPCPIQAAESQAGKSVCGEEVCGNITIPFPFGIETGCYTNSWLKVTCNKTDNRPYISRLNLEILGSYSFDSIVINNPVTYINCTHKSSAASINLTGSPFFFPSETSRFGSVGCGNSVSIFRDQTDSVGGCMQPTCGNGASESGCFGEIYENLTSYTIDLTAISPAGKVDGKRCASTFVFDTGYFDLQYPLPSGISIETTHVAARLAWNTIPCDLEDQCQRPLISNREEKCGDVDIYYPFGINDGSYMNDWFRVTCIKTTNVSVPSINRTNLQLLKFSFFEGTVLVNHSITSFNCRKNDNNGISANLTGSPFYFSDTKNVFWSAGCGNWATSFGNQTDHLIGGCLQPGCRNNNNETSINAVGCRMMIPPFLSSFYANMTENDSSSSSKRSCGSTFLVDSDFFNSESTLNSDQRNEISNWTQVPTTLKWGTPMYGLCELKDVVHRNCSSDGKHCWERLSLNSSYLCVCTKDYLTYSTATYTTNICQGRKCVNSEYKYCQILCLNSPGKYCSSQCPPGYEYISKTGRCEPKKNGSSVLTEKTRNSIIIGCSASIGTVLLLLAAWQMYKVLKRRKNIKLKQKYFKRNGGLLLQQHLSGNEGNVEKIKLFTSKELEKATDHYNENRILGQGGQGTVYKGMLTDGSIVAVKKSKMVDEKKIDEKKVEQFINEVIILSQINHRNVVKLLGCCLEVQVPLLVYEFIPNGTLSQLIHYQNDEFPLTWEMRLRIAIEIANALSYLHSSASIPIYHRDIKSSNILLDDKYRAKVSDFGTSRSIALDQTHLTTGVQGTFGYMDPEYFRSSQFTEKSDVYSFGVVLVEILTGQKPISSKQSEEVRSLVPFFLVSMQEKSLFNILDPKVANDGPEEEIMAVSRLAKRCLNLNGKKRPTMKQVAMELELIRASKEANAIQESGEEDSDIDDAIEPWVIPSCSTSTSIITDSVTLPLNASF